MPLEFIFSSKNKHLSQACPGAGVTVSEQIVKKYFLFLCLYYTTRRTYI